MKPQSETALRVSMLTDQQSDSNHCGARRQCGWGETGMQHGWGRTGPVGGRRVEEKEREKGLCKQGRQAGG